VARFMQKPFPCSVCHSLASIHNKFAARLDLIQIRMLFPRGLFKPQIKAVHDLIAKQFGVSTKVKDQIATFFDSA
jgi:hypothetical protein